MSSRTPYGLVARWNAVSRFADWSSEDVLARYVAERDEASFGELLRRHSGPVWAVCRRALSCPGLAEDAFQATFLVVVRKGHQFRSPGSVAAWLDRIARREAGTIRRKELRRSKVEGAVPVREAREDAVSGEQAEAIRSAVDDLPKLYRLPVAYRYLAGLSPAEVARVLGVSERTGRTRLSRGVEMLRERLAGKGLAVGAGLGAGTAATESALSAAAERVPENVLVATATAAKAVAGNCGKLAALLAAVTYKRAVVGMVLLAAGMSVALIPKPGVGNTAVVVTSSTQNDRVTPMRVSPLFALTAAFFGPAAPDVQAQAAYAWGWNVSGQLGDGTTTNRSTSVPVTGMASGVTAVSMGFTHSLAMQNGALFAWGSNLYGQLGNGMSGPGVMSSTPVPVTGMASGVTDIGTGSYHSLAMQNGALFSWGRNHFGQLGNGTIGPGANPVPAPVNGMASGVTAFRVGEVHNLAMQNGALFAWGANPWGQLGNGTSGGNTSNPTPMPVIGMTNGVTVFGGGGSHSLAVQNGALYAWGFNSSGQLGIGTSGTGLLSSTPVPVTGMASGVTAVSLGGGFSLALRNGIVYAWGDNQYGQLGNGTSGTGSLSSVPLQVGGALAGLTVTQVASGRLSSFALTDGHRLFAWGANFSSQLGNGTTIDSNVPVEIFAPAGFYFSSIDGGTGSSDHTVIILTPVPEPAGVLAVSSIGGAAFVVVLRRMLGGA